ncbi:MAG: hypothetical protein IJ584_03430 [Bacteroidales bacterium]|nr:hypothetical protein [Bacteroidales bacterium]
MTATMRLCGGGSMVARMMKEDGFSVVASRVGGMTSSLVPVADEANISLSFASSEVMISLKAVCAATLTVARMLSRRESVSVMMKPVESMKAKLMMVCESGVTTRYLEISPKTVWVVYGHAENDVLSNVTWNVN